MDAAITIDVAYTNGTGTPTYQWYENSICDPSTATAATGPGFNTDTYTPNTSVAATTYYFCVISFPANTGCNNITSLCAEIIVTPDPTIDIQPTNVTICEGGTIASPLTVSYTQGTGVGNVTYQWYDGVYPTGTIGTGTGQNTDS